MENIEPESIEQQTHNRREDIKQPEPRNTQNKVIIKSHQKQ